jgi:hypothetical protein
MTSTTGWTADDLAQLSTAGSLTLSAGDAHHLHVELGMVTVRGSLYVRAYRGTTSGWFQATQTHGHGRVWLGAIERDATFRPAGPAVHDDIDTAYRAKYGHDAGLVASPTAQAATVEIRPR